MNGPCALLGNVLGHGLDHQACTGLDGVGHMGLDVVVGIEDSNNSALRPGRGCLAQTSLGKNHNRHAVGDFECHCQARQTRAHNDNGLGLVGLGCFIRRSVNRGRCVFSGGTGTVHFEEGGACGQEGPNPEPGGSGGRGQLGFGFIRRGTITPTQQFPSPWFQHWFREVKDPRATGKLSIGSTGVWRKS